MFYYNNYWGKIKKIIITITISNSSITNSNSDSNYNIFFSITYCYYVSLTNISNFKASMQKQKLPPPNKLPTRPGVFGDKKLQIIGFDESETEAVESVLLEKGATIVPYEPNSSAVLTKELVDYTIMPITLPARCSNNNPATVYWMVKKESIELTFNIQSNALKFK